MIRTYQLDRDAEPPRSFLALVEYADFDRRTLGDQGMKSPIMNDRRIRRKNRRLDWRTARIAKAPVERDVKDIPEVQFHIIMSQCIRESIKRLSQPGLEISNDSNNFVNCCFVQQTPWPIDEQTNVFVKLNIRRQLHPS